MQFINKKDENGITVEITEQDIKKFNDMKELLGMCIDNTSQISDTIGVTLSITDTMAKINALMTKEDEQNGQAADELLESISKAVG